MFEQKSQSSYRHIFWLYLIICQYAICPTVACYAICLQNCASCFHFIFFRTLKTTLFAFLLLLCSRCSSFDHSSVQAILPFTFYNERYSFVVVVVAEVHYFHRLISKGNKQEGLHMPDWMEKEKQKKKKRLVANKYHSICNKRKFFGHFE